MSDFIEKMKKQKELENNKNFPKTTNFMDVFENNEKKPVIIAEVKNASPSLGQIANHDPLKVAKGYIKNGASAVSVLTEEKYFAGKKDYITTIKSKIPDIKILQKDFFASKEQICQAKILGASAVLLIVAMLEKNKLKEMIKLSYDLDLTPLVEVHNEKELNTALELKARLIGVNNRNLKTLKTDLKTSKDLAKYTKDATFISESGIFEKSQLDELYSLGYKGFLIGTSFMKTNDPANALKSFLGK